MVEFYDISAIVGYLMPNPLYTLLYRGKEKIHCEVELIIDWLTQYSPTNIISLALLVLRPKLVLLLTDVISELLFLLLRA